MDRLLASLILISCFSISATHGEDWSTWRGPIGDNHAPEGVNVPLRWNLQTGENIAWKTPVPGRGHSTPVMVGDAIFLTTADKSAQTQSLVKFDRKSGRLIDQWVLHRGTLPARIHGNNSHASPTPVFDGEDLLITFHTNDAIWISKVTVDGRVLWQKRVAEFKPSMFQFGYGASPIVEDSIVIVAAEYDGRESGLYGLDTATGKQVWKAARPVNLNFATPIVATIAGQRQILIGGGELIAAYEPTTGKQLWSIDSSTEAICGTVVWDDRRIIISGGNPASGTWCVTGDGSRELWSNRVKCYEQSLLVIPNYVFGVADSGVAYCWRTADGKEMWKQRLFGGGISASPLLVGDRIYIAAESGEMFVIAASPDRFQPLAEQQTGDSIFASPVAIDDRLYVRMGVGWGDNRQEYLVAIGKR